IAKVSSTGVQPGTDATKWQQNQPQTATNGEDTNGLQQADHVASGNGSSGPAPAWHSGTAYDEGDQVTFEGVRYQATADITAGQPDPENNSDWYAVKDGWKSALDGAPQDSTPAFVLGSAYAAGAYVRF